MHKYSLLYNIIFVVICSQCRLVNCDYDQLIRHLGIMCWEWEFLGFKIFKSHSKQK